MHHRKLRVRFAPSPTGALHIGGIRTALYNYLLAKKHNGDFILRIEDTDQGRYVEGAEKYIMESLAWVGLDLNEGPMEGGNYGPYRQSERKLIYKEYTQKLVENGKAYYAFDTAEEIEAMKIKLGGDNPASIKYDFNTRYQMKNSLTLTPEETQNLLHNQTAYVVRLLVPKNEKVHIQDKIRGEVIFDTSELDDKVLMKSDGMPTYHLANVVDDHLMEISHVIRGEEWLSSTAHHVLLYRAFAWEETMPEFAHLPLILKPSGNGKLSKRDGAQFGFPVFPINWNSGTETLLGFREYGFEPEALINFLALLGWNPGNDQEIFSIQELIEKFDLDHIHKAGARFDFDKAKWFNQQHIWKTSDAILIQDVKDLFLSKAEIITDEKAQQIVELYKERVQFKNEFYFSGKYLTQNDFELDQEYIQKKWKKDHLNFYLELADRLKPIENWESTVIESVLKPYIQEKQFKMGEVMPALRVMVSGISSGPDIYRMLAYKGKENVIQCILENSKKMCQ